MTDTPAASGRRIAVATVAALAVAIVILLVAVLPAEYGIDPLGTGRALGLVRSPPTMDSEPAVAPEDTYRVDAIEIEIPPYDYVEYKYRLAQSAMMIYAWEATAPLVQDFHGAPDGANAEAEVSLERRTRAGASGALTAAFSGMHGWYWENPGSTPIRVKLTSAGFYTAAIEYRSNRTRQPHEVRKP
jgi:hypothetical protein